jgi:hypothetical protein
MSSNTSQAESAGSVTVTRSRRECHCNSYESTDSNSPTGCAPADVRLSLRGHESTTVRRRAVAQAARGLCHLHRTERSRQRQPGRRCASCHRRRPKPAGSRSSCRPHSDQPDLGHPASLTERGICYRHAACGACSAGFGADLRSSSLVAHLWHTGVRKTVQPSQPASTNHARNSRSSTFQAGLCRSLNP